MAWDSPSQWNSTPNQGNIPGKTPKQEAMLSATNPLAGNARNTGRTSDPAARDEAERTQDLRTQTQQKQGLQQQQKTQQQQSGAPDMVSSVAGKLGNFGYLLREKVNTFLTKGSTAAGINNQSAITYNPDGTMRIADDVKANIDPTVAEKRGQQGAIRSSLSPFAKEIAGKLYGKEFDDVLGELAQDDPELAKALPTMLQLVGQLKQLEANGEEDSPESRALYAQLESLDGTGMVSGIKRAMDEYNQLMGLGRFREDGGLKYFGDAGDVGYSVLDLANMEQDSVKQEVEKSLIAASGLFGGDFEENLQRLYDTESEEVKRSNRQRESLHAQLNKAMKAFTGEYEGKFDKARTQMEGVYSDMADRLVAELHRSGNTKLAAKWAEAFSEGKDLEQVLFNAMNDPESGLDQAQKKSISNYIGSVKEEAMGEFGAWMDSLSRRGVISAVVGYDDKGNPVREDVEPSSVQKMEILRTLQSDMPAEAKEKAIREIIESTRIGTSTMKSQVEDALKTAVNMAAPGESAKLFEKSFMASMQTFMNSRTEDITRQMVGMGIKEWSALTPEQKAAAIEKAMQDPAFSERLKTDVATKMSVEQQQVQAAAKQYMDNVEAKKIELEKFRTEASAKLEEIRSRPGTSAANLTDQVMGRFSVGNIEKIQATLMKNPSVQMLMYNKKLTPQQLVDVAKAFNFHAAYRDVANQDPGLADVLYGGAAYAATVNPTDLLKNGDVAGLVALARETEGALNKNRDQVHRYILNIYNNARYGTNKSPLSVKLAEAWKINQEQEKQVQDALYKAQRAGIDVDKAGTQVAAWLKSIDQKVFDPSQLIDVALGAGNRQVEAGVEASHPTIDPNAIQTINGLPYVRMGDGRYQPIDLSALPGLTDTVTKGVGVSALPVGQGGGGTWAQVGNTDPTGGIEQGTWTPPAPPSKPDASPRPDKDIKTPATPGTTRWVIYNGKTQTPVDVPNSVNQEQWVRTNYPTADAASQGENIISWGSADLPTGEDITKAGEYSGPGDTTAEGRERIPYGDLHESRESPVGKTPSSKSSGSSETSGSHSPSQRRGKFDGNGGNI